METTKSRPKGLIRRAAQFPRLLRILKVTPFAITAIWTTGETRTNDFRQRFERWARQPDLAKLMDWGIFSQVVIGEQGSFAWPNVVMTIDTNHFPNAEPSQALELDPDVCYAESALVSLFNPLNELSKLLKEERTKSGITQSELAKRTGYTLQYINKLESGTTDATFGTLEWILKVGLGKRITVSSSGLTA